MTPDRAKEVISNATDALEAARLEIARLKDEIVVLKADRENLHQRIKELLRGGK